MPVSHYRESPADPLRIPLVYALTLGGSPEDPQGILSTSETLAIGGRGEMGRMTYLSVSEMPD